VKTVLRLWFGRAMVVCMHRSLVDGVVIAVCFHSTRVASGGNCRPRYPGSDNGIAVGIDLPHEGIVFGSSCQIVVLGGLPGAMRSSTLKMDKRLMEVTASEVRA
jgi:hypothetical protein